MKFAFPLRIKFLNMLYNEGVMYMKEFCKWLGVSEKFAKLVICLFVVMSFLIVTNSMLDSLGFPYYKLTVENLSKLDLGEVFETLVSWIMVLLSFYAVIFMVIPVKDFGKVFKYSIIYLALNIGVTLLTNTAIAQIFVILAPCVFAYYYFDKKWKYAGYMFASTILNIIMQFVSYSYKVKFIDFTNISCFNKFLVSLDYFIMMFIIILVKEIIINNKKKNK